MRIQDWLHSEHGAGHAFDSGGNGGLDTVVIVAVHSHVQLAEYVPHIRQRVGDSVRVLIVAMPCCVDQSIWRTPSGDLCGTPICNRGVRKVPGKPPTLVQPVEEYIDWGVHSKDRTVRVWDLPPAVCVPVGAGGSGCAGGGSGSSRSNRVAARSGDDIGD